MGILHKGQHGDFFPPFLDGSAQDPKKENLRSSRRCWIHKDNSYIAELLNHELNLFCKPIHPFKFNFHALTLPWSDFQKLPIRFQRSHKRVTPNLIPLLDTPLYQRKSTVTQKRGHFQEWKAWPCLSRGETWEDRIRKVCRNVFMSRIEARCLKLQESCRPRQSWERRFFKGWEGLLEIYSWRKCGFGQRSNWKREMSPSPYKAWPRMKQAEC